jgi:hypothetical protein
MINPTVPRPVRDRQRSRLLVWEEMMAERMERIDVADDIEQYINAVPALVDGGTGLLNHLNFAKPKRSGEQAYPWYV